MDRKGQGALEYLLLIGGAVLVAVIVIGLVLTFTSNDDSQKIQIRDQGCRNLASQTACVSADYTDPVGYCNWTEPAEDIGQFCEYVHGTERP